MAVRMALRRDLSLELLGRHRLVENREEHLLLVLEVREDEAEKLVCPPDEEPGVGVSLLRLAGELVDPTPDDSVLVAHRSGEGVLPTTGLLVDYRIEHLLSLIHTDAADE